MEGGGGNGRLALRAALFAAALSLAACGGGEAADETAVARGERVYTSVCTACHAADPAEAGSIGPAVAGSSYELLEARVVHGKYPEGYTPKMPGAAMPAFPYLADSIGDLDAYLAAAAQQGG